MKDSIRNLINSQINQVPSVNVSRIVQKSYEVVVLDKIYNDDWYW